LIKAKIEIADVNSNKEGQETKLQSAPRPFNKIEINPD
jgi:hypothetical protein